MADFGRSPDTTGSEEQEEQEEQSHQLYRAGAYQYLAALLRAEPSDELIERISGFSDIATRESELEAAMAMLGLAARTCEADHVREEYFSLFIGLGRGELVPYGSWYQTGFLMEKPLGELRDDLRRLGFERSEAVNEPEDHVAALWEVMGVLIQGGYDLSEQKRFFDRHMEAWVDRFIADLSGAKSATFYKAVARFAEAFTGNERRYMAMSV